MEFIFYFFVAMGVIGLLSYIVNIAKLVSYSNKK